MISIEIFNIRELNNIIMQYKWQLEHSEKLKKSLNIIKNYKPDKYYEYFRESRECEINFGPNDKWALISFNDEKPLNSCCIVKNGNKIKYMDWDY